MLSGQQQGGLQFNWFIVIDSHFRLDAHQSAEHGTVQRNVSGLVAVGRYTMEKIIKFRLTYLRLANGHEAKDGNDDQRVGRCLQRKPTTWRQKKTTGGTSKQFRPMWKEASPEIRCSSRRRTSGKWRLRRATGRRNWTPRWTGSRRWWRPSHTAPCSSTGSCGRRVTGPCIASTRPGTKYCPLWTARLRE